MAEFLKNSNILPEEACSRIKTKYPEINIRSEDIDQLFKKYDIAEQLLMEYHAALNTVREKIRLFKRKYRQSWNDFKVFPYGTIILSGKPR